MKNNMHLPIMLTFQLNNLQVYMYILEIKIGNTVFRVRYYGYKKNY